MMQTPRHLGTGRRPTAQFAPRPVSISRWKCDTARERGDARVEPVIADLISRARPGTARHSEQYRRELHVHRYRMLGSFQEGLYALAAPPQRPGPAVLGGRQRPPTGRRRAGRPAPAVLAVGHRRRRPGTGRVHRRRELLRIGTRFSSHRYGRVDGELTGLGYTVAPSSIWKIVNAAGIDPRPTGVARAGVGSYRVGRSHPFGKRVASSAVAPPRGVGEVRASEIRLLQLRVAEVRPAAGAPLPRCSTSRRTSRGRPGASPPTGLGMCLPVRRIAV
jgi:hypothetical protein